MEMETLQNIEMDTLKSEEIGLIRVLIQKVQNMNKKGVER
jgi:hypothetical protein